MRKWFLLFFIVAFCGGYAYSQQATIAHNLQGWKIGYIGYQLKLTAEEGYKFWPLFYDYGDEMTETKRQNKDNIVVLDETLLAIRKKYFEEFKKILGSDERANKVFLSDRDFGSFIKKEFEERQRQLNASKPANQ